MNTDFLKAVGRAVQRRRKAIGYTQQNLADIVEVSRESIANIERGGQNTTIDTLHKISEALMIEITELFDFVPKRNGFQLDFKNLRFFNKLRDREFKRRGRAEEWNIVDRSNELAGEVGELCNMAKKIRRHRLGMYECTLKSKEIEDEVADILITLDLFAMDLDISLERVTPRKFNESSDKFELETKMGQ